MEHEVFVPVAAERLRDVLADPARVARAVPGLQQDAGAEPGTGRLKLRVGGHSITYRGTLGVTARADGGYDVEGEAGEARGSGTVSLALTLRLRDAEGGCVLVFDGTAVADGRVTELPGDAVAAAAARLLTRFAENAGAAAAQDRPASVFDTEVPPSSLDPDADEDVGPGADGREGESGHDGFPEVPDTPDVPELTETPDTADLTEPPGTEPPAEAAHARRTMIGRSAEEVDHAPPRGRYAPVPAPEAAATTTPLRWAAPAAALVVASAIVVGRALRRRR
ncbi:MULTISPECIES: SRPBCC family protein [unclassified Streptomyces]|uniref:SRPBCC family protein n=1 Tax=unclassified Streptomyces TaxID=2593676 RepID=UPI0004C09A0B|nr:MULTISPECIES: SRPBCC family protein [unclassified Streptomyces]